MAIINNPIPKDVNEPKNDIQESDYSEDESDYDDENNIDEEENDVEEDNEVDDDDDDDEKNEDEKNGDDDNELYGDGEKKSSQKKSKADSSQNDDEEEDDYLDQEDLPGNVSDTDGNIVDETGLLDEEVDDEEDENYQRFENYSVLENLEDLHPEIRAANMDEIKVLSKLVRDSKGKIIDPFHTTSPFLTKYEKARVIGTRAEQIERGAPTFIKNLSEQVIHGRTIALKEFERQLIPFIIARPMPNKGIEYWKLQDLEVL
jgi:DNA-directed RNA polymerase subunit K/omega